MGWRAPAAGAADRLRQLAGAPETPVVAGVVLALCGTAQTLLRSWTGQQLTLALLLVLCGTLPVALLRGFPTAAALVVTAAILLSFGPLGGPTAAGVLAQLAVLYRLGQHGSRPLAVALAAPFAGYAVAAPPADAGGRALAVTLAVLTAGAAGTALARRARIEARAHSVFEQTIADTLLAHAARGERARIARELHDVVAHHISMISVQAETARLTTPRLPPEGARQLLAIGDTARTALTEMRRLLGVLREDADPPPQRQPQPGLQQLIELLDEARDASGTSTRLIVDGPVRALGPGIELTAYRIVQEALTNARRHAPGSAVDVELHFGPDTLGLRIRDNGPGPGSGPGGGTGRTAPGPGHGVLGMRERATMAGGTLRVGAAPGGGYLVEATLPSGAAA